MEIFFNALFKTAINNLTAEMVGFGFLLFYFMMKHNSELFMIKLDAHMNEEDKDRKHTDDRINALSEGMKIIQETVKRIDNAMERYAIANHDILDNELSQIDAIIYMSSTSVSNILKNALHDVRKGRRIVSSEELGLEITSDVQKDREKYHSELITKGVTTRTVALWEEVEQESFEGFMYRITQTFEKLLDMKGNGTVDQLIDRECELLRDYLHTDFMRRFKRRLSIIK